MEKLRLFKQMMMPKEKILWRSKPKFSCFLAETIFNPLGLVAYAWVGMDLYIFSTVTSLEPALIFLALHMMFGVVYIIWALAVFARYRCREYWMTTRALYVFHWTFGQRVVAIPYEDIVEFEIRRTIVDRVCDAGDVVLIYNLPIEAFEFNVGGLFLDFNYGRALEERKQRKEVICDIMDYKAAYQLLADRIRKCRNQWPKPSKPDCA